ncbi:jg18269 [Pararge aegeria aegeria]|uniref:Jg18269 protein n=1 Tax=Pararge aegeria aegeria TaxID=348720 RepID=A0A8S4SB51_9NEOP|nr:jg18269 [Pararge aegeria aegeria]
MLTVSETTALTPTPGTSKKKKLSAFADGDLSPLANILEVSPRDQIRNEEIRRRTNRKAEVEMGGAQSLRTDGRWGPKVLEWRPCTGKRSVGRPRQARRGEPLDTSGTKPRSLELPS